MRVTSGLDPRIFHLARSLETPVTAGAWEAYSRAQHEPQTASVRQPQGQDCKLQCIPMLSRTRPRHQPPTGAQKTVC
jgi:hypothetical protein